MSASSYANLVQELYVAYFGRPADYFGLQNFEAALAAANAPTDAAALATAYSTNSAVKSLVDSFGTSAESTSLYGSGTTESFVNAIFENLFNRPAAVAGLTFWVNAINTGAVSKGDAALAILAGAEGNSTTQGKADWALITAKIGVANDFTTALGASSNQIVSYSGQQAAQDARLMLASVTASTAPATFDVQTTINNIVAGNNQHSFDLTTGLDTIAGGTGNNVFNAVLDNAAGLAAGGQAATLQSFDTITGGTLNNTLNITDFGTGSWMSIPSGATITGITTLNINSLEGIAGTTSPGFNVSSAMDLTGWTDLTALNINSSNNYYNIVSVGDHVAVNVTTSGTSSEYVLTFGGSTVTLHNTSPEYTYNYVTGGADTSTVSVSGSSLAVGSETYVYDQHNSGNAGYDGGGTTPHWSAGTNTIATFNATNQDDDSYNYIYSDALTTINLTNSSYEYNYVYAKAGTRALTVNLNNDGNSTAYPNEEVYVEDVNATSVTINASGTATNGLGVYFNSATALTFNDAVDVNFYDGTVVGSAYLEAGSATKVTITGAGAFTADLSDLGTGAAIDASGSSGAITVEMASANGGDAKQSFVGGTGQDMVTVGATQTGTVSGGSATNNEIVLFNAPAATEANLAAYTHFSILGVAGTTSGTFDMSKLSSGSGYTHFDVQHSSGNVTFTNVAQGSTISLEGGNSNVVTLQTADSSGATDSTTVSLGTTTTGEATYTQVTLEDSINVGTGTLNLVSNVKGSASHNTLTSLYDYNWVTLNVSGTGGLTIGTSNVHSTALTIDNTEVAKATASFSIQTLNDNYLTSLTFNGSEGGNVAQLNSTSHTLSVIDNNAAGFEIGTLGDTALTTATFTNSVSTTTAWFQIDNALSDAGLATLNLNGNVAVVVGGDTVTSGITVNGGTDNVNVALDFSGAATAKGATDSVTLGNGDGDTVALGAGVATSSQTVVLGTGAGDVVSSASLGTVTVTVGSSTAGTDSITANSASTFHVTAGNGSNAISDTAASAATTITVGTGANSIMVGTAASGTITLGTHAATTADSITLGISNSTTTSVAGMEKVVGLNNAGVDSLVFSGEGTAITAMTHITASQVSALGGDTTLLSDWIATAAGKGGAVTADTVAWFQYQGNTYLVDLTAADAGALSANDTVVELTGTSYTFAKTTFTGGNGHVNLLG